MAKIYSKALRVIVQLGEEAVNTEGALEDIRLAANEESTERSKKEMNQQVLNGHVSSVSGQGADA